MRGCTRGRRLKNDDVAVARNDRVADRILPDLNALIIAGAGFIGSVVWSWVAADFGALEPAESLPRMILGATVAVLGIQTVLMSFVYSMFGIQRRAGRLDEHAGDG